MVAWLVMHLWLQGQGEVEPQDLLRAGHRNQEM
jgi:hypothetical protein